MKNLSFYIFLVLFFCNIGWTETSLPECKGSNYEKWTNCKGTETWENGRKYVGEFKDGKRYGQGIMTHPDGSKYIGQWKDGLPEGKGSEGHRGPRQGKLRGRKRFEAGDWQGARRSGPLPGPVRAC